MEYTGNSQEAESPTSGAGLNYPSCMYGQQMHSVKLHAWMHFSWDITYQLVSNMVNRMRVPHQATCINYKSKQA